MRDWREEIFFNLFGKTDNKILYFNFALATVIPILKENTRIIKKVLDKGFGKFMDSGFNGNKLKFWVPVFNLASVHFFFLHFELNRWLFLYNKEAVHSILLSVT